MASTGDIYNGPYASRAKEYVWSTLRDLFPRGITPTDIDGLVELNSCFFLFEGKTAGKTIDKGQGLALKRMLLGWDACKAVLVLGEHGSLDRVDVTTIDRIRFCWSDGGDVFWSPWIEQKSALYHAVQMFVRDANQGCLSPSTWCDEWTAMEAPF